MVGLYNTTLAHSIVVAIDVKFIVAQTKHAPDLSLGC